MSESFAESDQISRSLAKENYQTILNILTESPFFYAQDNPSVFSSLRRNKKAFEDFFDKYFGWRLYVDSRMARLIKDKSYNPMLRPSQKNFFNLTTRMECVLFMLLLEFYEHQCQEQQYSYDDSDNLRFGFGDYFNFVRKNLADYLHEKAPAEKEVDVQARLLFRRLEQYRLLQVVETMKPDEDDREELLIEVLPGLNCYEGGKMAEKVIKQSFLADAQDFAEPETEAEEEEATL